VKSLVKALFFFYLLQDAYKVQGLAKAGKKGFAAFKACPIFLLAIPIFIL